MVRELTTKIQEHPGKAAGAFFGATTIAAGFIVAFGPASADLDTNGKHLVVLLGMAAILCLWLAYGVALLWRKRKVLPPSFLGLFVVLCVGFVAAYLWGSPPHVPTPPPLPPPAPIPVADKGWEPWHPVDIPQKSFNQDTGLVSAVTLSPGEVDAFVVDGDGHVWNAWRQGDTWRWDELPSNIKFSAGTRQVTAVTMKNRSDPSRDILVVFAIGGDDRIWETKLDGRHWADWTALPPTPLKVDHRSQTVAAISRDAGKLDAFIIGRDGQRNMVLSTSWEEGQNNDQWKDWFPVPPRDSAVFPGGEHLSVVARSPVNLDLFVISGGKVYNSHWDDGANVWADWTNSGNDYVSPEEKGRRIPVPIFSDDGIVSAVSKAGDLEKSDLDIFALNTLSGLWTNWWANNKHNREWYGWFRVGYENIRQNQQLAVVARSPQNLDVFGLSPKGQLLMTYWRDQENQWSDLQPPPNLQGPTFSPSQQVTAVSPSPTELDLFVIGPNGELWTTAWRA